MATPEDMRQQMEHLTADLIAAGLCIDQNFPALRLETGGHVSVGMSIMEGLPITLKNIPYADMYSEIRDRRMYNLRLIDVRISADDVSISICHYCTP